MLRAMTDDPLMPRRREEVLRFLATRRSTPAKSLTAPYPGRDEIARLIALAARVPDHGKLEPWRFIVLGRARLDRLAGLADTLGEARGLDEAQRAKDRAAFADAGCVVAVISQPVASDKVPELEQRMSAAAVCYGLLMAGLASGWGANWLTGWCATDPAFLEAGLDVTPPAQVAGFIHLGTPRFAPPERPRPDVPALIRWADD